MSGLPAGRPMGLGNGELNSASVHRQALPERRWHVDQILRADSACERRLAVSVHLTVCMYLCARTHTCMRVAAMPVWAGRDVRWAPSDLLALRRRSDQLSRNLELRSSCLRTRALAPAGFHPPVRTCPAMHSLPLHRCRARAIAGVLSPPSSPHAPPVWPVCPSVWCVCV